MDLESIRSENLNKEIAYLFGVYLTDGSIPKDKEWGSYHFMIHAVDKDFVEFTLACIKKLIPTCNATANLQKARDRHWPNGHVSKCQPQWCFGAGFSKFGEWFINQTGDKHHIPHIMWDAPLDIKKWFIAGVMDGDGYIVYHTRPNGDLQWTVGLGGIRDGWVNDFKELLHSIGVGTNKEEIRMRQTPFVTFNIKIRDFVSHGLFFKMKRKQDRVKKYINGSFRD